MNKLPPDDPKYQKAVEKFERAKRRATQDKTKGSRAAEAKIKDLQDTNRKLSDNVLRLRKMLAWMYRDLPPDLRSKFDNYREALNNGTLNPDATNL